MWILASSTSSYKSTHDAGKAAPAPSTGGFRMPSSSSASASIKESKEGGSTSALLDQLKSGARLKPAAAGKYNQPRKHPPIIPFRGFCLGFQVLGY